jgi:hypothetical protein
MNVEICCSEQQELAEDPEQDNEPTVEDVLALEAT